MAKKNARIESVEIGITEMRKLEVYPLSLAAEKKIYALIDEIRSFLDEQKEEVGSFEDIPVAGLIQKAVEVLFENIEVILESVTRNEDIKELMDEIDNDQVLDIGKIIYKNNIESVKKKITTVMSPKETVKEKLTKP